MEKNIVLTIAKINETDPIYTENNFPEIKKCINHLNKIENYLSSGAHSRKVGNNYEQWLEDSKELLSELNKKLASNDPGKTFGSVDQKTLDQYLNNRSSEIEAGLQSTKGRHTSIIKEANIDFSFASTGQDSSPAFGVAGVDGVVKGRV